MFRKEVSHIAICCLSGKRSSSFLRKTKLFSQKQAEYCMSDEIKKIVSAENLVKETLILIF